MSCQGCNFKLVLIIVVIFGVIVPLFIQLALLLQPGFATSHIVEEGAYFESRKILYEDIDLKKAKIDALELQIKDLSTIKLKALEMITKLDRQRFSLQKDIYLQSQEKESLLKELRGLNRQIQKGKRESALYERLKNQKIVTNKVFVGVPYDFNQFAPKHEKEGLHSPFFHQKINNCTFLTCINFSKCSAFRDFKFHLEPARNSELFQKLQQTLEYTSSRSDACLELLTIDLDKSDAPKKFQEFERLDGNVVAVITSTSNIKTAELCSKIQNLKQTKNVIVYPVMCSTFRVGFDYVLPSDIQVVNKHPWKGLPPILPAKRQYLISFTYTLLPEKTETLFTSALEHFQKIPNGADVLFQTKCSPSSTFCDIGWCTCDSSKTMAKKSQYCLIPISTENSQLFSDIINVMSTGCVPVFIGDVELLPFSSTLDWKTVSIFISYQRLPELVFLLKSNALEDFTTLKRNGRFFFETYFSSQFNLLRTIIANFKSNIGLPPTPFKTDKSKIIKSIESSGLVLPTNNIHRHLRNLSYTGLNRHKLWNNYPGALNMIPVDPFILTLPSEFQFTEEGKDIYSPIGDGKGGDGIAFARSLGGDHPVEQFTVLMLTYDREVILMEALQRLSGMKYLHKVVVVWNNPKDPSPDLSWPDIDVKIEVFN